MVVEWLGSHGVGVEPPRWSWVCDDELEARGLELVLSRAGVPVGIKHQGQGGVVLWAEGESAVRAAQIHASWASRYVARQDEGQTASARVRERQARAVVAAVAAVLLAAIVVQGLLR